jgi:multiple sugar transport system ATP-binding protein
MNSGDIRQLGTPQELYENPADLFVAGFIGSPAMNFLHAQLVSGDGGAEIVVGEGQAARRVALAGQAAAASRYAAAEAGSVGRPVIAGVRPNHLSLAPMDAPNTLAGVVDVAEHLGHEQLLYVRIPGVMLSDATEPVSKTVSDGASTIPQLPTVVARLDATVQVRPGDLVTLAVDTRHIHVFDVATTERLT